MNNPAMGESVDRMASLVANCLPEVSKDKNTINTNYVDAGNIEIEYWLPGFSTPCKMYLRKLTNLS